MQLTDTATTVYTTYEKIFDHRLYTTLAKDDYAIHCSMWTCDGVHYILKTTNTSRLQYTDNASRLEIVPERVLVLFRPGTALFRFGLGTFFVPEPDLAKHFRRAVTA